MFPQSSVHLHQALKVKKVDTNDTAVRVSLLAGHQWQQEHDTHLWHLNLRPMYCCLSITVHSYRDPAQTCWIRQCVWLYTQGYLLSALLLTLMTHDCATKHDSNRYYQLPNDLTPVRLINTNGETAGEEEQLASRTQALKVREQNRWQVTSVRCPLFLLTRLEFVKLSLNLIINNKTLTNVGDARYISNLSSQFCLIWVFTQQISWDL